MASPMDWTALLAPNRNGVAGNPTNPQNDYIARLLMQQGMDSSPIQSPFQGLARMAQAYVGKHRMDADMAKQQQGNQAMADILAPPSYTGGNGPQQTAPLPPQPSQPPVPPPVAPPGGGLPDQTARVAGDVPNSLQFAQPQVNQQADPRNAQIAQLLNGGIGQDVFAKQAMDQLGFGTPKDPLKGAPGDIFFDPKTHQPIPGMSVPNKPDKPEATPDIIQIAKELFPNDPAKQHAYLEKNQPANLRAISNYNVPKQNWQILTDPKSGSQYRYDLDSGKALTLDGKPFTPTGASKLSSMQARSPAAMYLQKYQAEHPQADSGELADVAASFGAQQKAVKDFATGPEGNIVTRVNTAVAHLDTLQKIGEAMDNGDVQGFNKLRNVWRQQFGSELPTNFNAAMPIVAGEVSKAVVGTQGGTREDRAELEASLVAAASKRQLGGATGTQKSLLQGQLQSRRRQYEVSTGRKDFDKFLSGDTQRELGIAPAASGQSPAPATSASGWSNFKVH